MGARPGLAGGPRRAGLQTRRSRSVDPSPAATTPGAGPPGPRASGEAVTSWDSGAVCLARSSGCPRGFKPATAQSWASCACWHPLGDASEGVLRPQNLSGIWRGDFRCMDEEGNSRRGVSRRAPPLAVCPHLPRRGWGLLCGLATPLHCPETFPQVFKVYSGLRRYSGVSSHPLNLMPALSSHLDWSMLLPVFSLYNL